MAFDWQDFLDRERIAQTTKGTSGDNVRVICPWCNSADAMSISLTGAGWRCWKRPAEHVGVDPTRLVQALIKCSWQRAFEITGSARSTPDNVLTRVNALLNPRPQPDNKPLIMPPEFHSFERDLPSSDLFYAYLERRGFSRSQIRGFTKQYGLRYCLRGPFHGRIIFPILFEQRMVTWTGRTIYPVEELRYRTLTADPERAKLDGLQPAVKPITNYLLWYDRLRLGGECLVLDEGPFDALKVDVLGREHGISATCFFTTTPSLAQIELLHEILPRFKHRILLLDQNTAAAALHTTWQLQSLGVAMRMLPRRFKDPGELQTFADLSCILNLELLGKRRQTRIHPGEEITSTS